MKRLGTLPTTSIKSIQNLSKEQDWYSQVSESADRNRQLFFIWLAFAVFVITTTAAITDKQILLPDSFISLPTIIGVRIPLMGYFLFTPLLILGMHFNLIKNLDTHLHKLNRWSESYEKKRPPRMLLKAFIVDLALFEEHVALGALSRFSAELLCYGLGPITIGIIMWRFTDYQSWRYSGYQTAIYVIDLAITWCAIKSSPISSITIGADDCLNFLYKVVTKIAIYCLPLFIVLFELIWVFSINYTSTAFHLNDWKFTPLSSAFIPKIRIPQGSQEGDDFSGISDKIDHTDDNGNSIQTKSGPDLRGRSLQGAVLSGLNMRRFDFSGARLEGAQFDDSDLEKAIFVSAKLHEACFQNAKLIGANLNRANLEGSSLERANLKDAKLQYTNLRRSILISADLTGAELLETDFKDAIRTEFDDSKICTHLGVSFSR